jgi:hypothetical protein
MAEWVLSALILGVSSHKSSPVLLDDEGVIALLRYNFMGGAEEAATTMDVFLHAIITFRDHCVEQFGG